MKPAEKPLATVDRVTNELQLLMRREHDKALRNAYESAIQRLQALLFALNEAERPAVIPVAPLPAPAPPAAAPERVRKSVVIAMKPKRRG